MHHPNVDFEYLTCAPLSMNLTMPNLQNDFSELDIEVFITKKLTDDNRLPDFIMVFDQATDVTLSTLQSMSLNYQRCASFFHCLFEQDNNSQIVDVICLIHD